MEDNEINQVSEDNIDDQQTAVLKVVKMDPNECKKWFSSTQPQVETFYNEGQVFLEWMGNWTKREDGTLTLEPKINCDGAVFEFDSVPSFGVVLAKMMRTISSMQLLLYDNFMIYDDKCKFKYEDNFLYVNCPPFTVKRNFNFYFGKSVFTSMDIPVPKGKFHAIKLNTQFAVNCYYNGELYEIDRFNVSKEKGARFKIVNGFLSKCSMEPPPDNGIFLCGIFNITKAKVVENTNKQKRIYLDAHVIALVEMPESKNCVALLPFLHKEENQKRAHSETEDSEASETEEPQTTETEQTQTSETEQTQKKKQKTNKSKC